MMKKVVLALLLVMAAVATAKRMNLEFALSKMESLNPDFKKRDLANGCPNAYKCVSSGQTCGIILNSDQTTFTYGGCTGQTFCNITLLEGTCLANIPNGGACTTTGCGPQSACYNGVCTAITYNVAVGGACTEVNQCQGTAECEGVTCVASTSTGKSCNATLLCGDASSCINGTCAAWGTAKVGTTCTSTIDCAAGLACGSGVCILPGTNQGTACTDDTECNVNQACQCTSTGTKVCVALPTLGSSSLNEIVKVLNCFYDNSCPNPYTCSACSISSACQAISDEAQFADGVSVPSCLIGGPCELASSASTAVISLFAIMGAFLLML